MDYVKHVFGSSCSAMCKRAEEIFFFEDRKEKFVSLLSESVLVLVTSFFPSKVYDVLSDWVFSDVINGNFYLQNANALVAYFCYKLLTKQI